MPLAAPRLAAALLAAALATAGCGTGAEDRVSRAADPLQLATILPTRPGLVDEQPPQEVDAAGLATALAGRPDAGLARAMVAQGLERAAVRAWTARRGGRLTVATSLWKERRGAVGFGGEAAERLLGIPGARPWTPTDFGGSRGARFDAPGSRARALSFAVGRTGLFVRGTGAVTEQDVLRTMERLVVAAQGEDIS